MYRIKDSRSWVSKYRIEKRRPSISDRKFNYPIRVKLRNI